MGKELELCQLGCLLLKLYSMNTFVDSVSCSARALELVCACSDSTGKTCGVVCRVKLPMVLFIVGRECAPAWTIP